MRRRSRFAPRESERPPVVRAAPSTAAACRPTRRSSDLRMPETWVPRKIRATIATMAMSARISAYSARPWPSSSCEKRAIRALSWAIERTSPAESWEHAPTAGLPRTLTVPRGASNETKVPVCTTRIGKAAGRAGGPFDGCGVSPYTPLFRSQDARDLGAQEDQGDDRDDGDEREDQRVLGETLALLVLREAGDEGVELGH